MAVRHYVTVDFECDKCRTSIQKCNIVPNRVAVVKKRFIDFLEENGWSVSDDECLCSECAEKGGR